ncbi:unnamed protein product [Brachionus calyciflorus]|uniref:DDE-1 domain-containing protein n=1 Tax=Brachionus calyciflorus TaxID=104777 RepID=A0A814C3H7_9BILA|nr:unnamed protein product [Brachionus calyciflorus]
MHEESGSVSHALINDGRLKIKNLTKDIEPDDIYNIYETALFYKLEPNKRLSTQQTNGKNNAWMTAIVFRDISENLNDQIKKIKSDRKVLLLVDNASSYGTGHDLSHVVVRYLHPNSTSVLQPFDAGIIRTFKCHYRKLILEYLFESLKLYNEVKLPDLKQALLMVKKAWRFVDPECIKNC